jgi:2-phosphoglycerate kinase
MESCSDINMIFDRTFFTNEIYSRLGYQNYSFSDNYKELLGKLNSLKNLDKYNVYLVILYLENEELYNERIKRNKHEYQKFEVESSIKQQREYLKLAEEIEQTAKNINVIRFENDSEEIFLKNIDKYFSNL